MPADMTALGTGIPFVNGHHRAAIPARLVLQMADEFSPTDVGDRLGQVCILQQVLYAERLDTDHAGSGRMSLVVSWCRKSRRRSAMRACKRATFLRAFSRFLLPLRFLAWRRCRRASLRSSLRKKCSLPVFSPVESVTTSCKPRSMPTVLGEAGKAGISSSTRKETK